MVMAQSLFMVLKKQHEQVDIDVLAPQWSFPILERMPEVRKALAMPLTHGQFGIKQRMSIGKELISEYYDQAIVLPNSWKSALIPFFANIPKRTGYIGEMRWGLLNDARKLNKTMLTMTVQRFVALGLPDTPGCPSDYPVPELTIAPDSRRNVAEKFNVADEKPILALCPGAEYGPAKQWPASHYAELAEHKIAEGWDVWLFGSEKDQAVAGEINQTCSFACRDFSGKTSLAEAVDLMSLATQVVSNDSGLMHVAAALDKPLLAIYGSSDPGFTPPLNQNATIIKQQLECAPCFKRQCPLGHTNCLTQISAEQILNELTSKNQ